MRRTIFILPALLALGCAEAPPPAPIVAPQAPSSRAPAAEAAEAAAPADAPPLSFIEDDMSAATARAHAEGKALFVDVWAPWCHTCLSMKNYVLGDPALRPLASRVVFASIDSDKPENAAFLEHHEVQAWPTFFMIDPASDKVLGYWLGSSSVREMRGFIEEGLMAMAGRADDPASRAFAEARAAHAAGELDKARAAYEKALAAAKPEWPNRSVVLYGILGTLAGTRKWAECAAFGKANLGAIRGASIQADASSYVLACARQLPEGEERSAVMAEAVARLREIVAHPPADASVDDRADALSILANALEATGDKDGIKKAHEDRLSLMEKAAAAAKTPEEAQTFDYGRTNSYVALGRADEAIKMLSEREKQLPDSYEPPARLASVLFKTGKYPEALAAVDRALGRAYGPRKLLYLKLRADIQDKMGDQKARVATLREVVSGYEALPPGQTSPEIIAVARKWLEEAEKKGAEKKGAEKKSKK